MDIGTKLYLSERSSEIFLAHVSEASNLSTCEYDIKPIIGNQLLASGRKATLAKWSSQTRQGEIQ